jgi:hypothetical protein
MGFRGAYLSPDDALYADFAKQQANPRALVRLGLRQNSVTPMFELEERQTQSSKMHAEESDTGHTRTLPPAMVQLKAWTMSQLGSFALATNPSNEREPLKNVQFTVYDATSGKQLWTRHFEKESPGYIVANNDRLLILTWDATVKGAQEEINAETSLRTEFSSLRDKKGIALLELVDLATGKTVGKLLVETGRGSFQVENAEAAGDYVVVSDSENRSLVYRLSSGAQIGAEFGNRNALSAASNLLLVANNPGEAILYSLPTLAKIDDLQFGSRLRFARFSEDGKRLFVLTENQNAYILDVSGSMQNASTQPH